MQECGRRASSLQYPTRALGVLRAQAETYFPGLQGLLGGGLSSLSSTDSTSCWQDPCVVKHSKGKDFQWFCSVCCIQPLKDVRENDSSVGRVDFELPNGSPRPSCKDLCSSEVLSLQIYHPSHSDIPPWCLLTSLLRFFPYLFQLLALILNFMDEFDIHIDDLFNTLASQSFDHLTSNNLLLNGVTPSKVTPSTLCLITAKMAVSLKYENISLSIYHLSFQFRVLGSHLL